MVNFEGNLKFLNPPNQTKLPDVSVDKLITTNLHDKVSFVERTLKSATLGHATFQSLCNSADSTISILEEITPAHPQYVFTGASSVLSHSLLQARLSHDTDHPRV